MLLKSKSFPFFDIRHFWLKCLVLGVWCLIFAVAWLSFWLFSDRALSLQGFILQIWGADSQSFWQFSRIGGFLTYLAMWLSVMTGLSIQSQTSSYWYERGMALSWHQFFTWLAIGMGGIHTGVLLLDGYIAPTIYQLVVPFGFNSPQLSYWAWLWIGFGQTAWYAMLVIACLANFKHKIAKSIWKYLHALVLLAYVGSVIHGLFVGTDSQSVWAMLLYAVSNLVLIVVVLFRVGQMTYGVKNGG